MHYPECFDCTTNHHRLQAIALAQTDDAELKQLTESNSWLSLKTVPVPTADVTMLCDMSTGTPRPYIPQKFRLMIFDSLHSLSHPGIRAIQCLITACYVCLAKNQPWKWTRSCFQCQCSKIH